MFPILIIVLNFTSLKKPEKRNIYEKLTKCNNHSFSFCNPTRMAPYQNDLVS